MKASLKDLDKKIALMQASVKKPLDLKVKKMLVKRINKMPKEIGFIEIAQKVKDVSEISSQPQEEIYAMLWGLLEGVLVGELNRKLNDTECLFQALKGFEKQNPKNFFKDGKKTIKERKRVEEKIKALNSASGILNDLSPKQIKVFDDCTKKIDN